MFKDKLFTILAFCLIGTSYLYAQNMSREEIKAEYEKYNNQNSLGQGAQQTTEASDFQNDISNKTFINSYKVDIDKDSIIDEEKYFGYDFFTRRDSIPFWENLPTPPNYILGPGDQIIITLWGQTQIRKNYTITREGNIYNDKIGLLSLVGKSVNQAEKYLFDQYSRIYSTLKGNNPSTFMNLSIGELKSINVNFVGEVNYPGVHPVHPFSTLITGLIQAGGIDTIGSLRNIEIKRQGQEKKSIDLYNYLLDGELLDNLQLRDQDIVIVPVRKTVIRVDSAVYRPGVYESKEGETIKQIIDYAGGLRPNASSTIGLKRIPNLNSGKTDESFYVQYLNSDLVLVENGDFIEAKTIMKSLSQVEIIGQVKAPGLYNYFEKMKINDLFKLAGGFSDSTFWKSVYYSRAQIIRRNPKTRYESVIEINIKDALEGNGPDNISLENLDRVVVHANPNYFKKDNIQISGEVNIPGSYPLIEDNETLKSVINRAGGLTAKALENGVSIYRDRKFFEDRRINKSLDSAKVRVAWQNQSISLMPGDSILVKELTGTVNVSGQVYNPGLIEFRKGKSLNFYVNAAGGITDLGNKKGIVVIYPNGTVNPKKWYSSPKIEDSSTILINEKENINPFNPTEFASTLASFLSSVVTIMVLVQQLNS